MPSASASPASPAADPPPGLLCLLGTPQLQPPGGAPVVVLGPRDAALLALVVLHGPLARATLAGWMWPDLAPARALNNLRQRLFQLHQQTGRTLLQTQSSLALAAGWQHDLVPRPSQWRPGDALPQLLGGVDLRAWPALADRIDNERQRWQRAWLDAMVGHAEQLEAAGRLAEAQPAASAVVRADPVSEHAHRRLMRLHYLRGDNAAALAVYAACRRLLRQHLDATPGAETEALRDLVASGVGLGRPAGMLVARHEGAPAAPASGVGAPVVPACGPGAPPVLSQPQQRAMLRRPPVLVGRNAVWQAMTTAWHAGHAIVLHGPPGVGKTRLAEDFARAHVAVQVFQAQRAEQAQPLAALARWLGILEPLLPPPPAWALPVLAQLLPHLQPKTLHPEAPPPSALPLNPLSPDTLPLPSHYADPAPPPHRLQQAVLAWLASWPQAGLGALLIDDWPWIDSPSLQVLVAWLRQDTAPPVRLLLVQATDHTDAPMPPAAALPWWLQGMLESPLQVPLTPLPLAAVADLLADLHAAQAMPDVTDAQLPLLAQRLHQASGGLPGAALALLRAVPAAAWCTAAGKVVPSRPADDLAAARQSALVAVLAGRMAALPPAALRLLRLAALAGAQFDVALAAAVLNLHPLDLSDDWALLHAAHWLDSDSLLPEPLRHAVAAGVPPPIRQVLHAHLAQALAADGAAPEHCWYHWAAAQRWPEAAAAAADTACQARAAHMPRAELAAWDAAAMACETVGNATGAWQARNGAVWAALSIEPTARLLQRAVQLHDTASSAPQRTDALLAHCRVALDASEGALALAPAERALALATAAGDTGRALHASGWLWLARALTGAVQPALAQLLACAQDVANLPDLRLRLDVLGALGYVQHMAGHYSAAARSIATAATCAEQLGALGDGREQWLNLLLCANALGDRALAVQAGDRAMALWRRQGEPTGGAVPVLQLEVGQLKVAQGQFSSGVALLEQALAHFQSQPGTVWRVIAEHRLANAWLRLGQPARARQALTPLPDDTSAGGRAARAMALASLAHRAGQPAEALLVDALQRHGDQLTPMDRRALVLHLAATEAPEAALARCNALLQALAGQPVAANDLDDGSADVQVANHHANQPGNQPALVHALARRADALRRLGRSAEARDDARLAWQHGALAPPQNLEHLSFCHLLAQAAAAGGDGALLQQVLQTAVAWVDDAVPHLLPAWRHGFYHQHPVHRALLAMAAEHGLAPAPAEARAVAAA